MRADTLRRAALCDALRATRLLITATQQSYSLARWPVRPAPAPFYLRRARERLAEARKAL